MRTVLRSIAVGGYTAEHLSTRRRAVRSIEGECKNGGLTWFRRRKHNFDVAPRGEGRLVESLMLVSEDGLIWRKPAVFQEVQGDEIAFQFGPDGSVIAIRRLGSGGDASYPGFVELNPTRAVMSWYSSHDKIADGKTMTAIYMANLKIAE